MLVIWTAVALIVVSFAGFVRLAAQLRQKHDETALVESFLDQFVEWYNGCGRDTEIYNWMLHHSARVQVNLGGHGLISMRLPFEQGYHSNYPVILNAIPALQRELAQDRIHSLGTANDYASLVDGCLRRWIGDAAAQRTSQASRLRNPLAWFASGVTWLLGLPVLLLQEFHLISSNRRASVVDGRAFRALAALVGIVGLVSAVITIVLGWRQAWDVITGWVSP